MKYILLCFGAFMLLMCLGVGVNPPEGKALDLGIWYTMTAMSFGLIVMGIFAWLFEKSD